MYNIITETNEATVVAEYIPLQNRKQEYQSEAALEKAFIETLQQEGYEYIHINSEVELINNLQGGDSTGHYHLTYEQIQKLNAYIPVKYPPEIDDNQVIHCFANEAVNYKITGINLRME